MIFHDLDVVALERHNPDASRIPPGTRGTVVDGLPENWYTVEFKRRHQTLDVVGVEGGYLKLLWRDGKGVNRPN